MGAIGWIWAWAMLLGGVRAHLAHDLPRPLIWAMVASGIVALPLLWSRKDGLFAAYAPSGIVRSGLAILILVMGGIAYPQTVMGLVPLT